MGFVTMGIFTFSGQGVDGAISRSLHETGLVSECAVHVRSRRALWTAAHPRNRRLRRPRHRMPMSQLFHGVQIATWHARTRAFRRVLTLRGAVKGKYLGGVCATFGVILSAAYRSISTEHEIWAAREPGEQYHR